MAGIKTDFTQQENPGERGSGSVSSLGSCFGRLFGRGSTTHRQPSHLLIEEQSNALAKGVYPEPARQHAKHHEARMLQTATLAKRKSSRRPSPVRMPMGGAGSHPRVRPTTYASRAVGGGRQKLMIALIPVLAIALLYLLRNPVTVSTVATADVHKAEVVPAKTPDVEIAWEIPPLYQPGGRDPMRLPTPPVVTVEEAVVVPTQVDIDLIVTGILYSEDRPAAIVDTALVHEGDQISGATVTKIEKDGVQFEMNGRSWKQTVEIDKK